MKEKVIWLRKAVINYDVIPKPYGDQRNYALSISTDWEEYVRESELQAWKDECERLVKALEFYRKKENWKYTDGCGADTWFCTITDIDLIPDESIGQEGGFFYSGRNAKEALEAHEKFKKERGL